MYKMLVSTFDETLVDLDEAIPTSTMLKLEELRKKGILFVVATGKDVQIILDYNKDFPFIDYIVSLNGAYVFDVKNEEVIFEKFLSVRNVKKIKALFPDKKLLFGTLDGFYRDDVILYECKDDIYKIEVHCKTKREVLAVMRALKNSGLSVTYNERFRCGCFFVEIVSSKINKSMAVQKVMRKNKITKDEVLAIGVDSNDVQLLENAGFGVAMDNACTEIRKISDYITSTNRDKGVEKVIKNYF